MQDTSELSLPTQVSIPSYIMEGARNLCVNLDLDEDVGLSMPSPPLPLPKRLIHYYATTTDYGVEDEDNSSRGNDIIVDENNQPEENQMQSLSSFLKLPNAKVNEKYSHESGGTIRLSRQSQILTGDEYMQIYMEQEAKKKEIADLKARKKEQADERKAPRAIEREIKEQKKVENALKKQKKGQLWII